MVLESATGHAWQRVAPTIRTVRSVVEPSRRQRTTVAITDLRTSARPVSAPIEVRSWIAAMAITAILGVSFASAEPHGLSTASGDASGAGAAPGEPDGAPAAGLVTDGRLATPSASPRTESPDEISVGPDDRERSDKARPKPTSRPRPTATPTSTPSPTAAPMTPAPTPVPPTAPPPSPAPPPPPPPSDQKLLFGLGPTVDSAKDARLVREAPVRLMSVWYNGPGDLGWLTDAYHRDMYASQYSAGRSLHLIVWTGDPEGPVATAYGNGCGRAYPLSTRFVDDMRALASALSGDGTLYVTLFTEFQTYACADNAWNPTAETNRYWRALKDRYVEARAAIRAAAPDARVSLGWGGWQMRWDDPATGGGRSMLQHFAEVMGASDFQSFQAMQSDTNVNDVRAMTQALGGYGPVMLAHYKPNNGSQATFDADVGAMLTDAFIGEMRSYGLFAWSFMDQALLSSETTYQTVRSAVQRHGQ